MDIVINLLIWAHFVAFVAGGSNSVVGPVIAARMAGAAPDARVGSASTQYRSPRRIAVPLRCVSPSALVSGLVMRRRESAKVERVVREKKLFRG